MSEYSMPSYFQSMPVIGKDLSAFHEDNAAEIQAVEQEIHEISEAALEAGKSTEALNESGQWTAMQRIMELVDEGTWCPLNSLYIDSRSHGQSFSYRQRSFRWKAV